MFTTALIGLSRIFTRLCSYKQEPRVDKYEHNGGGAYKRVGGAPISTSHDFTFWCNPILMWD